MSEILGLIGYPVSHSLSYLMHNRAAGFLGLNLHYTHFSVPPEKLEEALNGVRALGIRGLNVTIPHKERVLNYLDDLSPLASLTGAVNTIKREGQKLSGFNTDVWGFLRSLEEEGFLPSKKALLLGAGGAARAVVCALMLSGVERIVVANRTLKKAEELVNSLTENFDRLKNDNIKEDIECSKDFPQKIICSPEFSAEAICLKNFLPGRPVVQNLDFDLIVNCTPVGMEGGPEGPVIDEKLLKPDHRVYDLVYNPSPTPLIIAAQKRGAKAAGGAGMLVYQGALAFKIWTGIFPHPEILKRSLQGFVL